MPLAYILRRVQSAAGISSPDLNAEQNSLLLDIINEAADEIYTELDLPLVLREVTVQVDNEYRICLPAFVGKIRAIRDTRFNGLWSLRDVRPRYTQVDWPEKWDKFRYIGESAVVREPANATPGTLEIHAVDAEAIVSLVGQTEYSNREVNSVTMDAVEKSWTTSYLEINAIRKNKITNHNIEVYDSDGNEIALLYADQLESLYQVVDVSQYPNISDCSDGTFFMEVLYKPRLPRMENDNDAFPVSGYDDAIVLKAKQLIAEDEKGGEQRALLMHEKTKKKLKDKVYDVNQTVDKPIFADSRNLDLTRIFRRWRA